MGEETAPYLAIKTTILRTEQRFYNYGKAGLLCGEDGLPHLIAEPGLALKYGHAGEVLIPSFLFIYIAGWIGYSGRTYLQATKDSLKEIIIDVPFAIYCFGKAITWPVIVIGELKQGTLTKKDRNITHSPR